MIKLEDFDAVIFDFDGTLYENHGIAKKLIKTSPFDMLTMLAERKTRKQLKGVYCGSESSFLEIYSKTLSSKSILTAKNAEKWYKNRFMKLIIFVLEKYYYARPKVNELFENLKNAGKKVAVLSDYNNVAERMNALKISTEKVDQLYASEQLGGLKPATQIFEKLCKKLEVQPSRVLVVGDRADTDGQGAKSSNMLFIQIKTKKTQNLSDTDDYPVLLWEDFLNLWDFN